MSERNTFVHKAVNVGSVDESVSKRANRIPALLVGAYPKDIRPFALRAYLSGLLCTMGIFY
jgi:hypothetical protein